MFTSLKPDSTRDRLACNQTQHVAVSVQPDATRDRLACNQAQYVTSTYSGVIRRSARATYFCEMAPRRYVMLCLTYTCTYEKSETGMAAVVLKQDPNT